MLRCREIHVHAPVPIERVAHRRRQVARVCAVLTATSLLSGCTWFSPDAGMGVVARIAQQELNKDAAAIRSPEEAEAAGATVRRLLGRTLTADAAVQVALLNNRGLQAAYDELAIADAERAMYQASEVEQFAPGHHGYPRASEAD